MRNKSERVGIFFFPKGKLDAPLTDLDIFLKDLSMSISVGGSGTMIRRANVIRDYFGRGGERGKIGRLVRVSFSVWKKAEHYNPEGSRGPDGE